MSNNEKIGVCATGKGPYTRSELVEKINASEKYYWIESINKDVKILLCEDPDTNSSKLTKAREKGIQLVKYTDFDFGTISNSDPAQPKAEVESQVIAKKKAKKESPKKKEDPEALRKKEKEQQKIERLRERVKEGLKKYEKLPKEFTNSIGMDFVLIPPGEYRKENTSESSDTSELDSLTFFTEPFYMGKFPVTQGDWVSVVKKNKVSLKDLEYISGIPLENVILDDVLQFMKILRRIGEKEYALPTEEEWRYATGAGSNDTFAKEMEAKEWEELAWTKENSKLLAHPVGEKKPNSWGLHDMIGNVWEITTHWKGDELGFKYMGGSWKTEIRDCQIEKETPPQNEPNGFRLVLRNLEITEEDYIKGEEIRRNRGKHLRRIEEWRAKEEERKKNFEKLPKEYINSLGMEFVLIPSGEYIMGAVPQDPRSDNEKVEERPPLRIVIPKPFYMGKYQVTQGEWLQLMENNPSQLEDMGENIPVVNIHQEECLQYIEKLNDREGKTYRLPREEEWEYSARGGNTGIPTTDSENPLTVYTYGDDPEWLYDYAWYDGNSVRPKPVGGEKPNGYGLYDMMGNGEELCEGPILRSLSLNRVKREIVYFGVLGKKIKTSVGSYSISYREEIGSKFKYENQGFRLLLEDTDLSKEEIRINKERILKKQELRSRELERRVQEEKDRIAFFERLPKEYINSLGMEFVLIPAGEFLMGAVSQDRAYISEGPQHRVRITKPFYIGKYPVSQGEWEGLMGNNPSKFKEAGKRAPVESVSWDDCLEFIENLNQKEGKVYRLPTEAEWENSARGKSTTNPTDLSIYTYGDDPELLGDYAWFGDNSYYTTHPVGKKKPNERGLYDMMGNVMEFCEDWYDKNYYSYSPINDPKGPERGGWDRVLRGGCFDNARWYGRLSHRTYAGRDSREKTQGFRLVLKELQFSEEELKLNTERKKNIESNPDFYYLERGLGQKKKEIEGDRVWELVQKENLALYEKLPKEITNSMGMEFVLIPAGEFLMGAVSQDKDARDSEKPQHRIRITKPFYMGKYPVTQGEWEVLMGNNPSHFKKAGKRAPVESVSWYDCREFIEKLNQKEGKVYRLPTEAEWEYSARGKSTTNLTDYFIYTFGDDPKLLRDYAWFNGNSYYTTHPVGKMKPNERGLYDMMGNVREFCVDWYNTYYYRVSPINDPKGCEKGDAEYGIFGKMPHVSRGGSWNYDAKDGRISDRNYYYPDSRDNYCGFRLVLLP